MYQGHIEVMAFDGTRLPADRATPVAPNAVALATAATRRWAQRVTLLRKPSPHYNCFGLVFASRRTNLLTCQGVARSTPVVLDAFGSVAIGAYDEMSCDELLKHDEYCRIRAEDVLTGDVIAYRDKASAEIHHVGFVVAANGGTPVVWSKWGHLGEYRHDADVCPNAEECTLEYWRPLR